MKNQTDLLIWPKNDHEIINFIAKKGTKNLLCIGINPKEENKIELLTEIANENGYDGWVLAFLYPKIKNNTSLLEINPDEKLFWDNINLLDNLIISNQFNFDTVLLNLGYEIDSFNQTYLKESAFYIHRLIEKHNLKFVCVGIDKMKNPISIVEKSKFKKFDFKKYVMNFKDTIKMKPEITINGNELK